MKTIIIALSLLACLPAHAETAVRVNSVNLKQLNSQSSYGLNQSYGGYRAGINQGFDNLPVLHGLKLFRYNELLTFGLGVETGYSAKLENGAYIMEADFTELSVMMSVNVKLHKNLSLFITGNNANLELNF